MNIRRAAIVVLITAASGLSGCSQSDAPYGIEQKLWLGDRSQQVWAIAPAIDLSGQDAVDPLLQADLLFQQLQEVAGLTVIPVNRVTQIYSSLGIEKVQSEEQAKIVCNLLGADALVIPTITLYDPYNPPKFGASLQLMRAGPGAAPAAEVNPRDLVRQAAPAPDQPMAQPASFKQSVGMYDAANGSVRDALFAYAAGRNDPAGPMGKNEYLMSMDRYCGFVYFQLICELVR
jgi:hypothetical protein